MLIITRTKSEHDQVLNLYMKVLDLKKNQLCLELRDYEPKRCWSLFIKFYYK